MPPRDTFDIMIPCGNKQCGTVMLNGSPCVPNNTPASTPCPSPVTYPEPGYQSPVAGMAQPTPTGGYYQPQFGSNGGARAPTSPYVAVGGCSFSAQTDSITDSFAFHSNARFPNSGFGQLARPVRQIHVATQPHSFIDNDTGSYNRNINYSRSTTSLDTLGGISVDTTHEYFINKASSSTSTLVNRDTMASSAGTSFGEPSGAIELAATRSSSSSDSAIVNAGPQDINRLRRYTTLQAAVNQDELLVWMANDRNQAKMAQYLDLITADNAHLDPRVMVLIREQPRRKDFSAHLAQPASRQVSITGTVATAGTVSTVLVSHEVGQLTDVEGGAARPYNWKKRMLFCVIAAAIIASVVCVVIFRPRGDNVKDVAATAMVTHPGLPNIRGLENDSEMEQLVNVAKYLKSVIAAQGNVISGLTAIEESI